MKMPAGAFINEKSTTDFVDPVLMPSAFKGCFKEGGENLLGLLEGNEAAGEANNIGVIVAFCQSSNFLVPA